MLESFAMLLRRGGLRKRDSLDECEDMQIYLLEGKCIGP